MMIGMGIPSSQNKTPLPKPMRTSTFVVIICTLWYGVNAAQNKKVPWEGTERGIAHLIHAHSWKHQNMTLIDNIKQWDGRATIIRKRPVWWKRVLIRIVVGTKFPRRQRGRRF